MTIQKRSLVVCSLLVVASALYGAARHYSPSLVLYVVEHALVQKAPQGADTALLQERLHAHLRSLPDSDSRMTRLLQISQYLEKVQHLTPMQIEELLGKRGQRN